MFKFSTQQLLRKRNHILSPYCQPHSLWFIVCVPQDLGLWREALWLFGCPWRLEQGRRQSLMSWGGDAQPPLPCRGSARGRAALVGAETPLPCLSLPLEGSTAKHKHVPNELDTEPAGWEQPPGADKRWGCWKRHYCAVWGHLCESFLFFPICGWKKTLYERTLLLYL